MTITEHNYGSGKIMEETREQISNMINNIENDEILLFIKEIITDCYSDYLKNYKQQNQLILSSYPAIPYMREQIFLTLDCF